METALRAPGLLRLLEGFLDAKGQPITKFAVKNAWIDVACQIVGGPTRLAEKLGVVRGAVFQWGIVEAERVISIERITRDAGCEIPRWRFRPDLWPAPIEPKVPPAGSAVLKKLLRAKRQVVAGVARRSSKAKLKRVAIAARKRPPAKKTKRITRRPAKKRKR